MKSREATGKLLSVPRHPTFSKYYTHSMLKKVALWQSFILSLLYWENVESGVVHCEEASVMYLTLTWNEAFVIHPT